MNTILGLFFVIGAALVASLVLGAVRARRFPSWWAWWHAEGVACAMVVGVVVALFVIR